MKHLPNFLIIGAMKCGTTSLYKDLSTQSEIYFPIDKEPGFLYKPESSDREIINCYRELYKKINPKQIAGDASTLYSKLPDYPGVAKRARNILGSDLKIIYVLRDPIKRIISHHHHEYNLGHAGRNINEEVFSDNKYINYSSYFTQLSPWLEAFDNEHIHLMIFEDYIVSREESIRKVMEFLNIEYTEGLICNEAVFNRSKGKKVVSGMWKRIIASEVYRKFIRTHVSGGMRQNIQKLVAKNSCDELPLMSKKTENYLKEKLYPEVEGIKKMLDRKKLWYS